MQPRLKIVTHTEYYNSLSSTKPNCHVITNICSHLLVLNDSFKQIYAVTYWSWPNLLSLDFNATCIDLNISDNCMLLTGYMALYKVTMMAMVVMGVMGVMMVMVVMITMMTMMIIGCVSSGTLRKCKSQLDSLSLPTNLQKESSFSFPHLMRIMINSFNKTLIQYHNANFGWMLQFHNLTTCSTWESRWHQTKWKLKCPGLLWYLNVLPWSCFAQHWRHFQHRGEARNIPTGEFVVKSSHVPQLTSGWRNRTSWIPQFLMHCA